MAEKNAQAMTGSRQRAQQVHEPVYRRALDQLDDAADRLGLEDEIHAQPAQSQAGADRGGARENG